VSNADTVADYNFTDGDKLDLSDLLDTGFSSGDTVADYVQLSTSGNNILVSVDANGTVGGASFSQVYTLIGVGTSSANDPVRVFFDAQDQILKV
jgi:hypothetical protein